MKNLKIKTAVKYSVTSLALLGLLMNTESKAEGEKYKLNNDVKVYLNSDDASERKNEVTTYKKGEYYVYAKSNGMVNISSWKNEIGSWINPNDNVIRFVSPVYKSKSDVEYFETNSLNRKIKLGTIKKGREVEAIALGEHIRFEINGKKVYAEKKSFEIQEKDKELFFAKETVLKLEKEGQEKVKEKDKKFDEYTFDKAESVIGKKIDNKFRFLYNGNIFYAELSELVEEKPEVATLIEEEDNIETSEIDNSVEVDEEKGDKETSENEAAEETENSEVNESTEIKDVVEETEKPVEETQVQEESSENTKETEDTKERASEEQTEKEESPKEESPKEESKNIEESEKEENSDYGQRVADFATQFVGYEYVFGGDSPSEGFDCSGLTSYSYYQVTGIYLGRTVSHQQDKGYRVSLDSLKPGDLLFFGEEGDFEHIGIYIGNGSFVHAATEERGVVIDSMSGWYATNELTMARRIFD